MVMDCCLAGGGEGVALPNSMSSSSDRGGDVDMIWGASRWSKASRVLKVLVRIEEGPYVE